MKAVGRGGRKGRGPTGGDVLLALRRDLRVSQRRARELQLGPVRQGQFDVSERFFGTKGLSMSPYSGPLGIDGDEAWMWAGSEKPQGGAFSASGSFSDNLAEADSEKQKGFIGAITSGQFHNQAAQGVEAALTAILGRQAAYTGREVTWGEVLRSNEHWDSGIDVNKLA